MTEVLRFYLEQISWRPGITDRQCNYADFSLLEMIITTCTEHFNKTKITFDLKKSSGIIRQPEANSQIVCGWKRCKDLA